MKVQEIFKKMLEVAVEELEAEKAETPKKPAKPKKERSGESCVLWEGEEPAGPVRAVAVDKDTNHSTPCLIVFERGTKDATGQISWRPIGGMGDGGANNLEATLAYELGKVLCTLPEWAKE
jgi:hypothetical protein